MDEKLTYSLIYTPSTKSDGDVNYVCSDGKIHIRFRDFNSPQLIQGFERKLTYLMAYLTNFSYIHELFDRCNTETIICEVLKSPWVKELYDCIRYDKGIGFKSFKFAVNYRKGKCLPFGNVLAEVFPLKVNALGKYMEGDLSIFLSGIGLTLFEYLFDDRYSILIHTAVNYTANEKFIRRGERKVNKLTSDFVNLW